MFKKIIKKTPSSVIVVVSCLALLVLFVFYFNKSEHYTNIDSEEVQDAVTYDTTDPYVTKVNSLEDMMTGPLITKRDPSAGIVSAPITIVEFSDFTCDYCNKQEQVLKKIMQKYEKKIRLMWKDFPENDKESNSYQASIAGRCAQKQEKFWPFHDFLFDFNDRLNKDTFIEIAGLLDMDIDQFNKCLNNPEEVEKLIKEDVDEANALGLPGIPFIYVNNQEIMGEVDYNDLEKIIDLELK